VRIVRYLAPGAGAPALGALDGDRIAPLGLSQDEALGLDPAALATTAGSAGETVALGDARLLAPVAPRNLICIGLNYFDHAVETDLPVPTVPVVFAKFVGCVIGPGEAIRIPAITGQVDYEGELAVVIGRTCRNVAPARALEHVFGYTLFNDVSARDLQFSEGGQWTRSKSLDTFGPLGPAIVTADEIPDPQALRLRTTVSGDVLQDAGTGDMIFGIAELIAFLSEGTTLEPGDVIATGTPPGVGMARSPQRFLAAGDEVEVEVAGIGTLRNPVVAG
jgi:2,4-diketo-3-deoxy-L-fuconate hydrolase